MLGLSHRTQMELNRSIEGAGATDWAGDQRNQTKQGRETSDWAGEARERAPASTPHPTSAQVRQPNAELQQQQVVRVAQIVIQNLANAVKPLHQRASVQVQLARRL